MPAKTLDQVSWWTMFCSYWGLGFSHQNIFFAMPTTVFYVRTPLFALQISRYMMEVYRQTLFSGVHFFLFPQSITCRIKEGMPLYRYSWRWGRDYAVTPIHQLN